MQTDIAAAANAANAAIHEAIASGGQVGLLVLATYFGAGAINAAKAFRDGRGPFSAVAGNVLLLAATGGGSLGYAARGLVDAVAAGGAL